MTAIMGLVAVILLPAVLLLPAAVAACWPDPRARRKGARALCLLFAGVAGVALVRWIADVSPRPAMPLGHHNLLAAWLVIVWPLALRPLRRAGAWRWAAVAAGALGVVTLAASGSFVAACALALQVAVAVWWWPRARPWLLLALALVWTGPTITRAGMDLLGLEAPGRAAGSRRSSTPEAIRRARTVFGGSDRSLQARKVYARAGWRGFGERPVLGWGPGSVPWTLADQPLVALVEQPRDTKTGVQAA